VVVEESQRSISGKGVEPHRQLCEFDSHPVQVDPIDTLFGNFTADVLFVECNTHLGLDFADFVHHLLCEVAGCPSEEVAAPHGRIQNLQIGYSAEERTQVLLSAWFESLVYQILSYLFDQGIYCFLYDVGDNVVGRVVCTSRFAFAFIVDDVQTAFGNCFDCVSYRDFCGRFPDLSPSSSTAA